MYLGALSLVSSLFAHLSGYRGSVLLLLSASLCDRLRGLLEWLNADNLKYQNQIKNVGNWRWKFQFYSFCFVLLLLFSYKTSKEVLENKIFII